MRRPDDLEAFLRQSDYLHLIAMLNAKLLLIKTELIKKMEQSNAYTIDFMYQTECIINYFLQDYDMYSTLKSKKYLNRILAKRFQRNGDAELDALRNVMPVCDEVPHSLACFDHLDAMANRTQLEMKPEHSLSAKELSLFVQPHFVESLVLGLRNEPLSWRHPLIGSYFWRARGFAPKAMACARRALYLSPRKHRDMALLSVGTVLQRANRTRDALVVLTAARDHAPAVAENQVAAANAYFLESDFNRSVQAFELARRQDEAYAEREAHVRKSMACFKFIKTKLRQIERQLVDMRTDLASFVHEKALLNEYYGKLLDQQVPIAQRLAQDRSFDKYAHQLLNRSQYCAVRKTGEGGQPVLSCDFYSELQLQLNKDTTIDTIQNYIETKMDFIRNQWELSLGVYKYRDIESYEGELEVPLPSSGSAAAATASAAASAAMADEEG